MLLVGGYTTAEEGTPGAKARGISAYDFSSTDGSLRFLGYAPAVNPSYLITDRRRDIVYAVREVSQSAGAALTAHRVSQDRRGKVSFELISEHTLAGDDPCHLAFAGNAIVVSCYTSGTLFVFSRREDGAIDEEIQQLTLSSTNGNPSRAHCAAFQESKDRLLVCDMGAQQLAVFDRGEDGLFLHQKDKDLTFKDASGPRHIALHPEGKLAVVNGEHLGVVHLLDVSGEKPLIFHTANALPERVIDEANGAAIRLGHNGKMVYCSDRAFSVLNSLRIDERAKKLIFRDTFPSGGEHPRDLAISPSGEWLLAANTMDHTIGVFRIDPKGSLIHYHTFKKIPSPTSLAWI